MPWLESLDEPRGVVKTAVVDHGHALEAAETQLRDTLEHGCDVPLGVVRRNDDDQPHAELANLESRAAAPTATRSL